MVEILEQSSEIPEQAPVFTPHSLSEQGTRDLNGSSESSSHEERPIRKRKKHTKSRLGCFPCKTRKIKCDENRPHCAQCIERDLKCSYPAPSEVGRPSIVRKLQNEGADLRNPQSAVTLNSTGHSFSMLDMQAFHCFLFAATPSQPFANDNTWLTKVPSIAYQNEYLMHAMLSQGAFHLADHTSQDVRSNALSHRVTAVAGVKDAMARFDFATCSPADRDSLIATLFILLWQSLYFSDGMNDFMTLARGVAIIVTKMWQEDLDTSFSMKQSKDLGLWFWEKYGERPPIDPSFLKQGIESLDNVRGLCVTEAQKGVYSVMEEVLDRTQTDPLAAAGLFTNILPVCAAMSTPAFLGFLDTSNVVSQVLLAHLNAMYLIFLPLTNGEWQEHRPKLSALIALTNSIDVAKDALASSPQMLYHMAWPDQVKRRSLEANGKWPWATYD